MAAAGGAAPSIMTVPSRLDVACGWRLVVPMTASFISEYVCPLPLMLTPRSGEPGFMPPAVEQSSCKLPERNRTTLILTSIVPCDDTKTCDDNRAM